MPVCITASQLMTAREVSENCRALMKDDTLMMMLELEVKKRYLEFVKEKAALTA